MLVPSVLADPDHLLSGKKKKPKPNLFGPDIFRWSGGLPREWVGAKKFGMSFEAQRIQTFLAGYPGILPGYPRSALSANSPAVILSMKIGVFLAKIGYSWLKSAQSRRKSAKIG